MSKDYRTIGQILGDELKSLNEVRYTNVYNRIKGVKGLSRKDLDVISAIDPDILAKVVLSLDFLKDDVEIDEAKVSYDGSFEKGRGPTGISFSIPQGHPDAINPKTGLVYPDRQLRRYKKAYKDLLKRKAPKVLRNFPVREESETEIDERAALVMNHTHIIDVILKDLHAMLLKQMTKGKIEIANNVAGLVGLKVTTKGQEKNKAYMYDLTKGKK